MVDSSVVIAAFDSGDGHHEACRVLMGNGAMTLATLDLARYEVANVAARGWRKPGAVVPLLSAVDRIADDGGLVVSTNSLVRDAAELAVQHGISVHDASYVAAAAMGGRRLVSCDMRDLVSNGLAVLPTEAAEAS
jgi:predicted nucleic acid-binding protein